jgi:predicted nucleotidyltransferase
MDFETVLKKIVDTFEENKVSYALIGGFALGVYGVIRATNDLDFLVDKRHENFLKKIMKENMYDVIYESKDVIQFEHPTGVFGSIDFLYALRKPSLEMLKRAVKKELFEETIIIKVLLPEDIIGLKVQAFINQPERKIYELEDIKKLIQANLTTINWEIIKEHFTLFKLNAIYKELRENYVA